MRPLIVVIIQIFIHHPFHHFLSCLFALGMSRTLFPRYPVKSFNKSLLIFLARSGSSATRDVFYSIGLPPSFELMPATSLDAPYGLEVIKLHFQSFFASLESKLIFNDYTHFLSLVKLSIEAIGKQFSRIYRIGLNSFSRRYSTLYMPSFAVFFPFGTKNISFGGN